MGKIQEINSIYKILGLYEDMADENSQVDLNSYLVDP